MVERKVSRSSRNAARRETNSSSLVVRDQASIAVVVSTFVSDVTELLSDRKDIGREDIISLSVVVGELVDGSLAIPTAQDFLDAVGTDQKAQLAKHTLEGIIASCVVQNTDKIGSLGLAMRLGRRMNQLEFLLGLPLGVDIVVKALKDMPVAERAVLCKSMSTTMKARLEYPDLYECDEMQMARYIRFSTYSKPKAENKLDRQENAIVYGPTVEQTDKLGTLIDAVLDREEDNFDIGVVLEELAKEPKVFRSLIRIAQVGGFLDELYRFFQYHSSTLSYARVCSRLLYEGDFREIELEEDL